jgi:hypothetical protein
VYCDGEPEVYPQARRSPPFFRHADPPVAAPPRISWDTRITARVRWGSVYFGTNYKMYEHRPPARINSPIGLDYTYRDQAGQVINLSDYVAVYLSLKRQGSAEETFVAEFDGSKSLGRVKYDFAYLLEGVYTAQFVVVDANSKSRWGDPAEIRAVKNVSDLGLDELMQY